MDVVAFFGVCWLIVLAIRSKNRIAELTQRVTKLEKEIGRVERSAPPLQPAARVQPRPVEPKAEAAAVVAPEEIEMEPAAVSDPPLEPEEFPAAPRWVRSPKPSNVRKPAAVRPSINWEQFMGVKGFAWIGGFALFLGVSFFIKYSFDNNLIPPQMRMALGFLTGIGLLVGGVLMSRKKFATLSETLCATGVLILYAATFACRSIYHFEFFGTVPTFLLMVLITTTAFLLAVRLEALVVAILGMLGGFLTPILLSTGHDNPLGLFGYIAILDAGLILVALNRRWYFLASLAALGTAIMQVGWADRFFIREMYFEGNKILVPLAVLLGFNALYLAANWLAKRRAQSNWWFAGANLGLAAVALAFTVYFFDFPPLAGRPVLLFSYVFLVDLVVFALTRMDARTGRAQPVAGLCAFGLLGLWTADHLTGELLNAALGFYFIFAVFHSVVSAFLHRRSGGEAGTAVWSNCFPPLALVLVLVPIFNISELSFVVWPFVLLVDLLAIVLAALSLTLIPVFVVLLLTLVATGALIAKIPATLTGLPSSFFLLGAFAVFFVVASVWLVRRVAPGALKAGGKISGNFASAESLGAMLPATSAMLPFLLLVMATLRLPLLNPSPVFGLALLLVALLLGMAVLFAMEALPLIGLAGVFALECVWHFGRFDVERVSAQLPLTWYLVFLGVFAAFPFLFLKKFLEKTGPWAAAALAGPAQFLLVFRLVKTAWPNSVMGLLPAVFAIPSLLSLAVVLKKVPAVHSARLSQLAWFGGVALFFVTLIFPIQFDRQWITIGWALEGAALLWLFHRVPHPGLRGTGFALLVAAFVRLALNPAVFEYHQRSANPIFNWYLYTYGIVTAALFAGAMLLAPPRNVIFKQNAQPVLASLGTVLAFLLMNIEIADYFSEAGSTLTFQFSGNFARDMTYSITWGLFALGLLVYGILKKLRGARYAAMALLSVTLLKLFFHDLAQLGPLYRIGAFIGVAVIAMLASFAYQKFFTAGKIDENER